MNQGAIPSDEALSQLIGLIYCTADDSALWPELLLEMGKYLAQTGVESTSFEDLPGEHLVAGWFDGSGIPMLTHASNAERQVFSLLAPHFARAHEIHRHFVESDEQQQLFESTLDRIPLGIAITDSTGTVISANRPLHRIIEGNRHLAIEGGRLVSRTSKSLSSALQKAAALPQEDVTLRLGDDENGLAIHTCRLDVATSTGPEAKLAVFVASRSTIVVTEENLNALYETTPAEGRLIRQLMLGGTLERAAKDLQININTAKAQLKSIFRKVNVQRQSELMSVVHSSLSTLRTSEALADASIAPPGGTALAGGSILVLPDGRRLSWSDTGDVNSIPMILMHGIPGSRVLRHPDGKLLSDAGIRLIIPERPGIGDSDPQFGRTIADWPNDIQALADHLGLDTFAVVGFSAGTAYALATACQLPKRVKTLHLIGAAPPIETISDLKYYSPQFRAAMMVARYSPGLLAPLLGLVFQGIRKNVYRYVREMMCGHAASDQRAFDSLPLRENFVRGLLLCYKNVRYVAPDLLLMVNGWSVSEMQPEIPVQFIHGDVDWHISAAGAMRIAEQIDGARFHLIPNAGHFLIYSHWQEILDMIQRAYLDIATT